jgi:hypothetical protein
MKNAGELYEELLLSAGNEFGLVIEPKTSKWYWRVAGYVLTVLTFGNLDFANRFFTTFGNRIGVTPSWDSMAVEERYIMLLHEVEHMKQYKKAGFGNVWLGFVIAGIGYLLLPLPIGLAWIRTRMEMAAYTQTVRAIIRVYGVNTARNEKTRVVSYFTSWSYLFMWPFKRYLESWYDDMLERVAAEEGL